MQSFAGIYSQTSICLLGQWSFNQAAEMAAGSRTHISTIFAFLIEYLNSKFEFYDRCTPEGDLFMVSSLNEITKTQKNFKGEHYSKAFLQTIVIVI